MDIQFYGANTLRLSTKKASIIIDDNLADLGLKTVCKAGDIALYTGAHASCPEAKIIIDQPGEYEVSDVSVNGIAARGHIDEPKQKNATIYKIVAEDIRVVVIGHIYPELNDDQLESIGTVDILFIPVGGNGYTLDGIGALKIIKDIEPKLVVPTHYADEPISYPVPQQSLNEALKNLGMDPKDTLPRLKIKAGELNDLMQLIVIERQ